MQYRTFSDLSTLIRRNIHRVPHDIDIIVGIPRSGMIPAYMIALYLNKRVTDIDSFIVGKIVEAGERDKYIRCHFTPHCGALLSNNHQKSIDS